MTSAKFMNYSEIKKLDEETLEKLTEGYGPSDECLCSVLAPPGHAKSFRASIRKAFGFAGRGRKNNRHDNPRGLEMPVTFYSKGQDGKHSTKEVLKRASPCGKCGCDRENVVLKHSFANIRITTPDISSVCPCPTTDCMPDKEKFINNIKVTVEHAAVDSQQTPGPFQPESEELEDRETSSE